MRKTSFSSLIRNTALGLTLSIYAVFTQATNLKNEAEADQASEQFMSILFKGETLNAYDSMKAYINSKNVSFTQVANDTQKEMDKVWKQLGAPVSFNHIQTSEISGHFRKLNYLLKFNDAALVWTLVFYQAEQGWNLVGINYSTDIEPYYTTVNKNNR